jgi:hypothetical protein
MDENFSQILMGLSENRPHGRRAMPASPAWAGLSEKLAIRAFQRLSSKQSLFYVRAMTHVKLHLKENMP